MKVYGAVARLMACRDGKENWHETTEYEVTDQGDIHIAEWLQTKEIHK